MTEGEIRNFIKKSLGEGTVDVELTEFQLDECIDACKAWYAQFIGQNKSSTITLVSGTTEYAVPDDCYFVYEVNTDSETGAARWGWPLSTFNMQNLLGGGYGRAGGMPMADLTQSLQYAEQMNRLASSDIDWFYDQPRRLLVITPSWADASIARIWYQCTDIDVTKIILSEVWLVKQYAYAHAMEILGNIRTKFSELPSAAGGFTMNGDLLSSNALEMKQRLTDQLKAIQPPVSLILG